MMRLIIVSIVLLFATSGCYDSHKEPPTGEFVEQENCNIMQLKQLCKDGYYSINSELVFVGRITTSDREGNFYRSMVVEGTSGGMEVLLGIYDIAAQYPIGLMVAIDLRGTAIMLNNGILQVGLPPRSFDSTPREFESQTIIDRHIKRSNSIENIEPLRCDIASLNEALCGRFIEFNNIYHNPLSANEEENTMCDYHRFTDNNGYAVFTYISPYADFPNLEIPTTNTSIQGILYRESVGMGIGEQFVIRPRFADDISIYNTTI